MFAAYGPSMSNTQGLGRPPTDRDVAVVGPLAVDHVLAGELPATLGTVDAPAKYLVTAILTRRPDPLELQLLEAPAVREQLAAAGYPGTTLAASDRRLLIGNTDLHELETGLARLIGTILVNIAASAGAQREPREGERIEASEREASRAEAVIHAAKRISFGPRESMYR